MKQIYLYQDTGTLIEQGKQVVVPCHPEAHVSAVHKRPDSDTVTITLHLRIWDTRVGKVEEAYTSMLAVRDAGESDDRSEVWKETCDEATPHPDLPVV